MSGITTGIGIFSGIDTASLIDQLISIEARPRANAQRRLSQLQSQQAAVLDLNSRLLSLGNAAKAFRQDNVFKSARATSSNSDVLSATARNNATLGSFNFVVNRLVSTHQLISRGFSNPDTSAVGATEFSFEVGGGRIDAQTRLSELNGGLGIDRGKIRITDADGAVAEVDLSAVSTVEGVLQAINSASGVNVTASADGYGLRIENVQKIDNVFGSDTASSLGIAKTATGSVITGDQIHTLGADTPLSLLNDGGGVAFDKNAGLVGSATADFRIIVDGGGTHSIVLGELRENVTDPDTGETSEQVVRNAAATLGDLIAIIEEDTGGAVTASISADGTRLELTSAIGDVSVDSGPSNRPTARDLGLLDQPAGATLTGRRLLAGINSTLTSNLNGGSGLTATDLLLETRDGAAFNVTLDADSSLSDIVSAINTQTGGSVVASLNDAGNGLKLKDTTTGGAAFTASGGAADDLSLTGAATGAEINSGNLQTRWITEATTLKSLNAGAGVGTGSFTITDSNGGIATINVNNNDSTLFDVIRKINGNSQVNVSARINDNGDGLLIEDEAGGSLALKIADSTGRVARNLNLVGEGDPDEDNIIDGSYERTVTFNETDTLNQVVEKINSAGVGVNAAVVNDGFGASPFRLVLTSGTSGAVGRVTLDTGGFDLGASTLSRAQDAIVFIGSSNPADAVLLTSSSNTLDNVINGVSIDLNSTSPNPVEVNVTRDTSAIEAALGEFVEAYNGVIDRLAFHGRFNQETGERGVLLGDGLLQNIQRTLTSTVQGEGLNVESEFDFLFQIGVRVGEGGKLEFDSEQFRQALEQDPAGVAELIAGFQQDPQTPQEIAPGVTVANTEESFSKLGVAELINRLTRSFTDSIDGVLTRRKNTFDTQIELQESRIEAFNTQLDQKRIRLERQFLAMEQALAQLQGQQSALSSLSSGLLG